jgi:transposase
MFNCKYKDNCPYLNNRSAGEVLAENDYCKKRVEHIQEIMKLAEEKILSLEQKIKLLEEEKESIQQELNHMIRKPFKPNLKKDEAEKTSQKRGAPVGHPGVTRKRPVKIDEYLDVYPTKCDKCGSEKITVYPSYGKHIVEDIEMKLKTTCFRKHLGYCRKCKKVIYPESDKVIPKSYIGPVARATGGYLRYLGIPFDKVQKIFNDLFGFEISSASLVSYDRKMGENGLPLYEQIKQMVRHSSSINCDETGWRVDGEN